MLDRRARARRRGPAGVRVRRRRVRRRQDAPAARVRGARTRARRARAARPLPRARRRADPLRAARGRAAPARARARRRRLGRATTLPDATRNALAELLPELGGDRQRAPTTSRARARAACSRRCCRCSSGSAARAPVLLLDRGPALGRRLDARLHHVPRAQRARGAALPRRDLPLRRAAPAPSAAPAAGRARARRRRRPDRARALRPRRGRRAARGHPPGAGARRRWPSGCTRARRATRSTPRSCSRRPRTATAGCCPRRCATSLLRPLRAARARDPGGRARRRGARPARARTSCSRRSPACRPPR